MPSAVAIIPARFASTRFPGKVLAPLLGRPMLEHVHAGVSRGRRLEAVVIAVDDERVARAARAFGAEVVLTRADHPSGTDRVAEVAERMDAEVIVNVQGDEPLVRGETVDTLAGALLDDPHLDMATLAEPIDDPAEVDDPNVVKVVAAPDGRALYFSRAPIPHGGSPALRHVGLYAYRRETLLGLARTPPTPLEISERLEQLRALELGLTIRVLPSVHRSLGVDTPEDLARAEALLRESE